MMRPTCSLIAAVALALLAGCADDAPPGAKGSPENPLVARTDAKAREPGAAQTPSPDAAPGYQKLVQRQSSHPRRRFTPCNLVTRNQARAIVGEPIRQPVEAPQGPTCIYRTENGGDLVSLAVQEIDFRKVKGQLRHPTRVNVSSRTGVCGQYGQPMLYVPISKGRTLTIAAPCAVAKRFGSSAIKRLDR